MRIEYIDRAKEPVWTWQVLYPWSPGMTPLRSRFANRTYEQAWDEARMHADYAAMNNVAVAVKVYIPRED